MIFIYRDTSGHETLRKVRNAKEDEFYIKGYCEYSHGVRTFNKKNILGYLDENNLQNYNHVPLPTKGLDRKDLSADYHLEICFTGFKADDRKRLESLAGENQLKVRKAVTASLDFLCIGENAGSSKLKAAEDKGCYILTADQFHDLINDGLLPDGYGAKTKGVVWSEISLADIESRFIVYAFTIKKAHWAALGVQMREFIDRKKTAIVRATWEESNPRYKALYPIFFRKKHDQIKHHPDFTEWENLKKERASKVYKYATYALSTPVVYDFQEGDVFHGDGCNLQVINDYDPLEIKLMKDGHAIGYQLNEKALDAWLKTGSCPSDSLIITKNQSKSPLAQFYEYTQ